MLLLLLLLLFLLLQKEKLGRGRKVIQEGRSLHPARQARDARTGHLNDLRARYAARRRLKSRGGDGRGGGQQSEGR